MRYDIDGKPIHVAECKVCGIQVAIRYDGTMYKADLSNIQAAFDCTEVGAGTLTGIISCIETVAECCNGYNNGDYQLL